MLRPRPHLVLIAAVTLAATAALGAAAAPPARAAGTTATAGSPGSTPGIENHHDDDPSLDEIPRGAEETGTGSAGNGGGGGPGATSTRTTSSPVASRYAALDRASCEAELVRRHVSFDRVGEARGVLAPVRLTAPLSGVDFHSMLPAQQRRTSPYEIYDCRLVLALDDFARILARYDVTEVIHYSVYRPPASRAPLSGPGRRHAGGLAIDAALFRTKDGRSISVEKDFHGRIGAKTCGASAAPAAGLPKDAATLRHIVCDAADAQLFHVMLTPDYNWQHRNHFHLEVTAGVRWSLVR